MFGLFYRQPFSLTLSKELISGFKKEQAEISFLACFNNYVTELMPLMIIGNPKNPHAFKEKAGQELGFDFHSNKNVWMTRESYFARLNRLD